MLGALGTTSSLLLIYHPSIHPFIRHLRSSLGPSTLLGNGDIITISQSPCFLDAYILFGAEFRQLKNDQKKNHKLDTTQKNQTNGENERDKP